MFELARNPDGQSSLPFLLKLPVDGGVVLWPVTSRVYCHSYEGAWPEDPEIVERVPVRQCRRRGSAIDLVLDRARNNRA